MDAAIQANGLSKNFKGVQAVSALSFTVPKGEVYGFLGQNGAGKSTTLRMLLGLIRPDGGDITVNGYSLQKQHNRVLRSIGAIIEKPDLYNYLTARQNLQLLARLSGVTGAAARIPQVLELVGLTARAGSKVKTFSQGMKQRLGLAAALVHDPPLLILDEPTNGLDPQGIADMRNLILGLSRQEGKTVLLSSHLLSEIEVVADNMLIIDKGKKVVEGRVSELLNPMGKIVTITTTNDDAAKKILAASGWAARMQAHSSVRLHLPPADVPALIAWLVQQGVQVSSVQSAHSLEDYFLSLTTPNQHVASHPH